MSWQPQQCTGPTLPQVPARTHISLRCEHSQLQSAHLHSRAHARPSRTVSRRSSNAAELRPGLHRPVAAARQPTPLRQRFDGCRGLPQGFLGRPWPRCGYKPFASRERIQPRRTLADILLLFIYLEIGAMVGVYFKTTRLPVRYLIYIAITALARVLIEIVGAEHQTGTDILVVSGAILLLSFAVLVLRFGSHRYPSDSRAAGLVQKSNVT